LRQLLSDIETGAVFLDAYLRSSSKTKSVVRDTLEALDSASPATRGYTALLHTLHEALFPYYGKDGRYGMSIDEDFPPGEEEKEGEQ
jgi:hypothetical protein